MGNTWWSRRLQEGYSRRSEGSHRLRKTLKGRIPDLNWLPNEKKLSTSSSSCGGMDYSPTFSGPISKRKRLLWCQERTSWVTKDYANGRIQISTRLPRWQNTNPSVTWSKFGWLLSTTDMIEVASCFGPAFGTVPCSRQSRGRHDDRRLSPRNHHVCRHPYSQQTRFTASGWQCHPLPDRKIETSFNKNQSLHTNFAIELTWLQLNMPGTS